MDLTMPAPKTAKELYDRLADDGLGEKGTQALVEAYDGRVSSR